MAEVISVHNGDYDIKDCKKVSKNNGNTTFEKVLFTCKETGMFMKHFIYQDGAITPWHRHDCGHGMYVLKGTLHTSHGDFKPGECVWFEEGVRMYHGAEKGTGDCECLFFSNKTFNIHYFEKDELLESEDIKYLIHRPE